jgi:hypothetical protein
MLFPPHVLPCLTPHPSAAPYPQSPPHSEYVLSWLWSGATSSLTRPLSGGVGARPLVLHACAYNRSRLATPSRNPFAWGTQEASAGPSFAFPASLVNGVSWRSGGYKSASRCCMHTRAHMHPHDVGYLCIDKIASRCCSRTHANLHTCTHAHMHTHKAVDLHMAHLQDDTRLDALTHAHTGAYSQEMLACLLECHNYPPSQR